MTAKFFFLGKFRNTERNSSIFLLTRSKDFSLAEIRVLNAAQFYDDFCKVY